MFKPGQKQPPKPGVKPGKKATPEVMRAQAAALRKPRAPVDEPEENPSKPGFLK